jgi:hypothetical protein
MSITVVMFTRMDQPVIPETYARVAFVDILYSAIDIPDFHGREYCFIDSRIPS